MKLRNRRTAQRGKDHPVQRHHPGRERPGGQLPFLHHRAQHRRRSRCPTSGWTSCAAIWEPDPKKVTTCRHRICGHRRSGAAAPASGAGLGNKFLAHIRECDAIVHVVRCFDDENIVHVVDDVNVPVGVDPEGDIDAIDMELILADLEVVQNRITRQSKAAKTGNKDAKAELAWRWNPLPPGWGEGKAPAPSPLTPTTKPRRWRCGRSACCPPSLSSTPATWVKMT